MSARERILQRIRRGQSRGAVVSAAEREQRDTYLKAHPRGPLRASAPDLIAEFIDKAEAAACTCERVSGRAAAPSAVSRYLSTHKLPLRGCVWPALNTLPWDAAGLSLEARAARGDDLVGVTGAFCALAETGTLMLVSGPQTPASVSLLPETHVALVAIEHVVAAMEDGWDLARRELGTLPRAVNFVSGPSRTADIEQTLVLGAHGPYRVHIVLIG